MQKPCRMKKTVLLITSSSAHRLLYKEGLRKRHFDVETDALRRAGKVDAVVYDITTMHSTVDLRWLKSLNFPVVVLTCEDKLSVPLSSENRRILSYPVKMDQIIQALAELGVEPESGA